jgi:hypothetical protein
MNNTEFKELNERLAKRELFIGNYELNQDYVKVFDFEGIAYWECRDLETVVKCLDELLAEEKKKAWKISEKLKSDYNIDASPIENAVGFKWGVYLPTTMFNTTSWEAAYEFESNVARLRTRKRSTC